MGSKRERQADRAVLAAYHEARLSELVEHIAVAVDRLRAGQLDAFGLDEVLRQHSRAARELWKFCWLTGGGAGNEPSSRAGDRLPIRSSCRFVGSALGSAAVGV